MTKREKFVAVAEILANVGQNDYAEFINDEVAAIDKRKENDRKRAEEKKAQGDETRALVKSVLSTDTAMSVVDVMKALGNDDLTPGVITARLTQLVKYGEATKQVIKTENGQKTVYTLA